MSDSDKMRKILVTGAGGQLGADLGPALAALGLGGVYFTSADLDITDRDRVFDLIGREAPSVVINAAAYTKVDLAESEQERAFAVNAAGAANVAAASKAAGAALIHISTDFVFDGEKSRPYKEDDAVNPLSTYGKSKLRGEEEVQAACPRHYIIRTSWLYGAKGHNFVRTILRLAAGRDELRVVSDQVGSPTWTGDLAKAVAALSRATDRSEPPAFGIYHYSDEGVASWYDLAVAALEEARRLGLEFMCREVLPIPTEAYPTPAPRPAYSVLDKTKIKEALGLCIPHWRASLVRMLGELKGLGEKRHG